MRAALVVALVAISSGVGCLGAVASTVACTPAPTGPPAPAVTIDLGAPAGERWKPAVAAVLARYTWEESFGQLLAHFNATTWSHIPVDATERLSASLAKFHPEWHAELEGLAQALRINPTELTGGWAWYHDVTHTEWAPPPFLAEGAKAAHRDCSGLLAVDASTGRVVHGRNHDDGHAELMRRVTLHLSFVDSSTPGGADEVLFEAVSWYWFGGGLETMVKVGVATMQENWRTVPTTGAALLKAAEAGAIPQNYIFRHVLSDPAMKTFADVAARLASVPVQSAFYIIMSGPGPREGAIITRSSPTEPEGSVKWPVTTLAANATDGWFLVETNYDRWLPDPASDPRRTAAMAKMRALGQSMVSTDAGMACVASTPPVRNSDTIFTAILRADVGVIATYVPQ